MFLLVPAYPGSPGQKAVKRLCVCVSFLGLTVTKLSSLKTVRFFWPALYFGFVDLEKAFDRVPREVISWAMRKG